MNRRYVLKALGGTTAMFGGAGLASATGDHPDPNDFEPVVVRPVCDGEDLTIHLSNPNSKPIGVVLYSPDRNGDGERDGTRSRLAAHASARISGVPGDWTFISRVLDENGNIVYGKKARIAELEISPECPGGTHGPVQTQDDLEHVGDDYSGGGQQTETCDDCQIGGEGPPDPRPDPIDLQGACTRKGGVLVGFNPNDKPARMVVENSEREVISDLGGRSADVDGKLGYCHPLPNGRYKVSASMEGEGVFYTTHVSVDCDTSSIADAEYGVLPFPYCWDSGGAVEVAVFNPNAAPVRLYVEPGTDCRGCDESYSFEIAPFKTNIASGFDVGEWRLTTTVEDGDPNDADDVLADRLLDIDCEN
jgi:hypothetical protein